MFLVNSRHHHFSAALQGSEELVLLTPESTPSSEGTGLFCRVPWPEFSRAPRIIHPTHLSWFAVRFGCPILRSFSWQHGLGDFMDCSSSRLSTLAMRICLHGLPTGLHLVFQHQARLSSCVPPSREQPSTRILTRFPSATHFCLALGAD